jgi:hypothetical protein
MLVGTPAGYSSELKQIRISAVGETHMLRPAAAVTPLDGLYTLATPVVFSPHAKCE